MLQETIFQLRVALQELRTWKGDTDGLWPKEACAGHRGIVVVEVKFGRVSPRHELVLPNGFCFGGVLACVLVLGRLDDKKEKREAEEIAKLLSCQVL